MPPSRKRASRFAFSDAGHSVTSGFVWLAATLHFASSRGAAGAEARGIMLPAHPTDPVTATASIQRARREDIEIHSRGHPRTAKARSMTCVTHPMCVPTSQLGPLAGTAMWDRPRRAPRGSHCAAPPVRSSLPVAERLVVRVGVPDASAEVPDALGQAFADGGKTTGSE